MLQNLRGYLDNGRRIRSIFRPYERYAEYFCDAFGHNDTEVRVGDKAFTVAGIDEQALLRVRRDEVTNRDEDYQQSAGPLPMADRTRTVQTTTSSDSERTLVRESDDDSFSNSTESGSEDESEGEDESDSGSGSTSSSDYDNFIDPTMEGMELSSLDQYLFTAVKDNDTEAADVLVWNGANVNVRGVDGKTPLFHCRTPQMIEVLLGHGANLNETSRNGADTVLNRAIDERRLDMVTLLIQKGANTWVQCISGDFFFSELLANVVDLLGMCNAPVCLAHCTDKEKRPPAISEETREQACMILDRMKRHKEATLVIQRLLGCDSGKKFLLGIQGSLAPVRSVHDMIGSNISWNILLDPKSARDRDTNQAIYLN